MNLNDEMVEMMKFYEFYKKIKASEEKDKLTNKNNEFFKKTEGAINKSEEVELNSYSEKINPSNKTEGANTKDKKRLKKKIIWLQGHWIEMNMKKLLNYAKVDLHI